MIISSGGGHAEEKFILDQASRAVAELLELFLPRWRSDLHLNKPGVSPGNDDGDGPSVVTSKRKAGSICQVSSLLRFYYLVYRLPFLPLPLPNFFSVFFFPDRLFYTRQLADLLIYERIFAGRRQGRNQLLMHFYWAIILCNLNPSMELRCSDRHYERWIYITNKADVVSTRKHKIKDATTGEEQHSAVVA